MRRAVRRDRPLRPRLARVRRRRLFGGSSLLLATLVAVGPANAELPAAAIAPDQAAHASADNATVTVRQGSVLLQDGRSDGRSTGTDAKPLAPGALGTWLGVKPALWENGIDLSARYINETGIAVRGAQHEKPVTAGQLDLTADVDMAKLAGIQGGRLHAMLIQRHGKSIDQISGLRTLQPAIEIYGRGDVLRVSALWYEQAFLGEALNLKVGRTSPAEDFAAFSCDFINLTFCGAQPGAIAGSVWQNTPIAMWGGRFRVKQGPFYAQIGAYEVNPRNLEPRFTIGRFGGATGVLVPIEIGWIRDGHDGGGVGILKLGGWKSSANAPDVLLAADRRPQSLTDGPALMRPGSSGAYLSAEQQIFGQSQNGQAINGMTIYLNATRTDRRTSRIADQVSVGVFWCGILLPKDTIALAVGRTHINPRVAAGERAAGREAPGSEYAVELFYRFRPKSWLAVQPNLEMISRAGGYRSSRTIGVVGLKTVLTL